MVMLIDDDMDDCDIFSEAATEVAKCRCHCVQSPKEALKFLDKTTKLPDCIFLDINMPAMNGFEVLARLKTNPRTTNIPVVVYSVTPNPDEAARSLKMGALRFVRKTANYKGLVRTLEEIKEVITANGNP